MPGDTQAPIAVGGWHTYRLRFPDPGLYWYHLHLREDCTQELGLYGIIEQIRALGVLGVPTFGYNWMALSSWGRTDLDLEDRGGALVTGYVRSVAQAGPALIEEGQASADSMWDALEYFLKAVVPEAEAAGVGSPCTRMTRPRAWIVECPAS